jgi:hypothetical protein
MRGAYIFYIVASVLALWLLLSIVLRLVFSPFGLTAWLQNLTDGVCLYSLYFGYRRGDSAAVKFVANMTMIMGAVGVILMGFVAYPIREMLWDQPLGTGVGNILWPPILILVALSFLKILFGAALYLPSVHTYLIYRALLNGDYFRTID